MSGVFGMGIPATIALTVVVLLAVATVALPPGRRMLAALVSSVMRWPALIRAELRGAAPLRADGDDPAGRDGRVDTTPDIPVVTRGLPVVERSRPAGR